MQAPGEERHPGCSGLGDDGMQQLICTNGPRKAGSALQRRTHSSNNLNSSAFPSKKSLRMEERPYSGISPPTCTETWLGMLENSCLGREKHQICNVGSSSWKKLDHGWMSSAAFCARLDRLRQSWEEPSPEHVWLCRQPKAKKSVHLC